jgi:hypothetical protein
LGEPEPESELSTLAVLRKLFVFVYLSSRVLVVVVPFSRPVVADVDDEDDADDEDDEDDEPAVIFALGESDEDERRVTC